MSSVFPVTHSILSIPALLRKLAIEYDLVQPLNGHFLHLGVNDTFLIRTPLRSYILRVYRWGWRTREQVLYELEALHYLHQQGAKVAAPIVRRDGGWMGQVQAPEGLRYLALFHYIEGSEPRYDLASSSGQVQGQDLTNPRRTDAALYGRAVAQIHRSSEQFRCTQLRFKLDFDHLLARPLHSVQPLLSERPRDWEYLVNLCQRLQQKLEEDRDQLEFGFCHGDLHGGNAHFQTDRGDPSVTFFDFDCCGFGWRAYDLAVFRWSMSVNGYANHAWTDFLKGYRDVRPIAEVDIRAIADFVPIRQVWMLGLHCANGGDWGFGWLNDRYFDRALQFLRSWNA